MSKIADPTTETKVDALPLPDDHETDAEGHEEHSVEYADLVRIGLVALAVAASWFEWWSVLASFDFIALAAVLLGGFPIYREAIEAIRERRMTMELSMTIALLAALTIGEFFTALVIVLFVLIAEALESLTVGRGRRAHQGPARPAAASGGGPPGRRNR